MAQGSGEDGLSPPGELLAAIQGSREAHLGTLRKFPPDRRAAEATAVLGFLKDTIDMVSLERDVALCQLRNEHAWSFDAIGRLMGLSGERARQLYDRAVARGDCPTEGRGE